MKTIYKKTLTTSLLFLTLIGCTDLLEEKPYDFSSPENFYKTALEAQSAVTAAYGPLKEPGYYQIFYWYMADGTTDEIATGTPRDVTIDMFNLTYNPNSRAVVSGFDPMLRAIANANAVIDFVPNIAMDETLKKRYVAEARFLRALTLFNMTNLWGSIPMVTNAKFTPPTESEILVARTPKADVYQQVITDLTLAESDLPTTYPATDNGRATKGAALSLLAKVYLYNSDWANASATAKRVIDLNVYSLFPDYLDVFRPATKNGREHIFSIQRNQTLPSSQVGQAASRRHNFYANANDWRASVPFFNRFPADYRRDVTFITFSGVRTCGKYVDPAFNTISAAGANTANSGNFNNTNDIVLRYADVLLMYAEALNELNGPTTEAYNAINLVRRRARGVGLGAPKEKAASVLPDLAGLTKDQFRDAVLNERNFELCYESQRRFDLIRTGRYVSAMTAYLGKPIDPTRQLFPIPQPAIDINPALLPQNDGYN
jgi:starch-binding outer membrane protein, SusD/RagB family